MRRRRSTVLATLAVTGLLLAGCGSDDGDDVTVDSAPASESTASTTEADEVTEPDDGSSTTPADQGDGGSSDEGTDSGTTATSAPDGGGTTEATDTDGGDGGTDSGSGTDLSPGDPCSLEEGVADCIDPDGDGQGTYLTGGASCMANAVEPSVCEDLDGDGAAGYPDEYDGLPTCSADVPPPCNNPEDPDAEDQG